MKILLIDGTNGFVRYYAVLPHLDPNGEPIGGVVGFLRSLASFVRKTKADKVIIVWDGPGGSQKRRTILKDYKKGRKPIRLNRGIEYTAVDSEKNKIKQRVILAEYLKNLPVEQITIQNIEADDVIGYLVGYFENDQKIIVSNDKDFFQLLNERTIIYSPTEKEFRNRHWVYEKYGIHCHNFALARAIIGDRSDNIDGIRGIGLKRLLQYFPFFREEKKISVDDLIDYAKQNGKKYERFVTNEQVIIDNHKVMQLERPIISVSSILKIEEGVDKKTKLNSTCLRMKLMRDNFDLDEAFFEPFRGLEYRRKG